MLFRTVFDEKGYLVMELFPNVAKLFGISLVSKKFNKVLMISKMGLIGFRR